MLTCQIDSYLKSSTSQVKSCQYGSDASKLIVILDNSILYPEAGGQPCDFGLVNEYPVIKYVK